MGTSLQDRYLAEFQIWVTCVLTGFVVFALGSASLFSTFALIGIEISTTLSSFGIVEITTLVILSLLLSNIIVNRLWEHAKAVFVSIAQWSSKLVLVLVEDNPRKAKEKREEGEPLFLFLFSQFALIGIGIFLVADWTCDVTHPIDWLTNMACNSFRDSLFRESVIATARFTYAAFGVSGVLFLVATFLEILALWRGSFPQQWLQSTSLTYWWNPMAEVVESENNENDQQETDRDE